MGLLQRCLAGLTLAGVLAVVPAHGLPEVSRLRTPTETLDGVTVLAMTAETVTVRHAGGLRQLEIASLVPEDQALLGYDPIAAREARERREAERAARIERERLEKVRRQREEVRRPVPCAASASRHGSGPTASICAPVWPGTTWPRNNRAGVRAVRSSPSSVPWNTSGRRPRAVLSSCRRSI
jgi:hypothetical protein